MSERSLAEEILYEKEKHDQRRNHYSPITLDKSEYKELIKTYSESDPPYDMTFSKGYVRCLYDYDLINRDQWNYLLKIINKWNIS